MALSLSTYSGPPPALIHHNFAAWTASALQEEVDDNEVGQGNFEDIQRAHAERPSWHRSQKSSGKEQKLISLGSLGSLDSKSMDPWRESLGPGARLE